MIDASALFAGVAAGSLPTVGFTAYGGVGDDTIIGSQAGDHLAGGSGDDPMLGQRGVDHLYGDSGVNVDILTRALTIPASTRAIGLMSDPLTAGEDRIYGEGAGIAAGGRRGRQRRRRLRRPRLGPAGRRRPEPAESEAAEDPDDAADSCRIESEALQNGADDVIFGSQGLDILIGGAGNDAIDGDDEDDLVFGDIVQLRHRIVSPADEQHGTSTSRTAASRR